MIESALRMAGMALRAGSALRRRRSAISLNFAGSAWASFSTTAWASPRSVTAAIAQDEMKNKKDLIRVVRSPEGDVSLDFKGKKPGRGAYVCPDAACRGAPRQILLRPCGPLRFFFFLRRSLFRSAAAREIQRV